MDRFTLSQQDLMLAMKEYMDYLLSSPPFGKPSLYIYMIGVIKSTRTEGMAGQTIGPQKQKKAKRRSA